MTSQYRCQQCLTYFEQVRWEETAGGRGEGDGAQRLTLPAILLDRAQREPEVVAMRVKRRGIYRDITWRQYRAQVESVCRGFKALGLEPGDRLAILGDPCPEWLLAEMGTLAAGGICYGIYPTSSPAQVAALLKHGGASIVVVKDQECADKILGASRGARRPCAASSSSTRRACSTATIRASPRFEAMAAYGGKGPAAGAADRRPGRRRPGADRLHFGHQRRSARRRALAPHAPRRRPGLHGLPGAGHAAGPGAPSATCRSTTSSSSSTR